MTENLATIFSSITAFFFAVLGLLHFSKRLRVADRKLKNALWTVLIVSFVLSLICQVTTSIHQHAYKSDLVLRFEDKFEDKLASDRAQAARAINEYLQTTNWDSVTNDEELDGLENILGFFDELGFYWKNGEIGGAVLHEHFYNDMRIYCQESLGYIRKDQKRESIADWEYVEPLLNELTKIETTKTGKTSASCRWNKQTLQESLKAEIRLQKSTTTSAQNSPSLKKRALTLAQQIQEFTVGWKDVDSENTKSDNVDKYLTRFGLRARIMRDDLEQSGQSSDVFNKAMYEFSSNYKDVHTIQSEIERLAKNLPD